MDDPENHVMIWAFLIILICALICVSIVMVVAEVNKMPTLKHEWVSMGVKEITSYNAVREQCDNSPDYGAGGRVAIKGVPLGSYFACNTLPFGAVIKIPAITGDREWICRDRTARRLSHRIDLLMPIGKTVGLRQENILLRKEVAR